MERIDITMYSDRELSLLVLNEEPLYRVLRTSVRMGKFSFLLDHVSDIYNFTEEQEEDLLETWQNEEEEYNNENK